MSDGFVMPPQQSKETHFMKIHQNGTQIYSNFECFVILQPPQPAEPEEEQGLYDEGEVGEIYDEAHMGGSEDEVL